MEVVKDCALGVSDPNQITPKESFYGSLKIRRSELSLQHITFKEGILHEQQTMGKKDKASGGAGATSSNVYIMDKDLAWIPARLVETVGDKAIVSVPIYADECSIASDGGKGAKSWEEREVKLKNYPGKNLPMQNVDKAGILIEKEDMCDLPYLHEVSVGSSLVICCPVYHFSHTY
jgi:hypothetical protein